MAVPQADDRWLCRSPITSSFVSFVGAPGGSIRYGTSSGKEAVGGFEEILEGREERGGGGRVEGPVVDREREPHRAADGDRTLVLHHGPCGGADGEDRGLGRVDDRGELVDPEHAEVGDGEGPAPHVGPAEGAGAGLADQLPALGGDAAEALDV